MRVLKQKRLVKSVLLAGLLTVSLPSAWALPKEIEIDRLVLGIETAVESQNWDKAHARLITLKALDDELPAVYFYYRGKVSAELEDRKAAREALEQYLALKGKDAEFYKPSLSLLNEIEEQETQSVEETVKTSVASHLVLEDSEHKKYINQLRTLYLVDDGRDALELHINTLLLHHRYIPGRYRSDRKWAGSLYQIQVRKSVISIMEKRSNSQGGYSINQDQLGIYGVNPYLSVNCDSVGSQCWVQHPESGKQWLELESNRKAANDIAQAFTHLIRYMQGS